jgi:hypothetical protein
MILLDGSLEFQLPHLCDERRVGYSDIQTGGKITVHTSESSLNGPAQPIPTRA